MICMERTVSVPPVSSRKLLFVQKVVEDMRNGGSLDDIHSRIQSMTTETISKRHLNRVLVVLEMQGILSKSDRRKGTCFETAKHRANRLRD